MKFILYLGNTVLFRNKFFFPISSHRQKKKKIRIHSSPKSKKKRNRKLVCPDKFNIKIVECEVLTRCIIKYPITQRHNATRNKRSSVPFHVTNTFFHLHVRNQRSSISALLCERIIPDALHFDARFDGGIALPRTDQRKLGKRWRVTSSPANPKHR